MICKEFANKGDKGDNSWRPVRLIHKRDWEDFSDQEKKIYLMGYIDSGHFFLGRVLTLFSSVEKSKLDEATLHSIDEVKKEQQDLEACFNSVGIEGLFRSLSKQAIEWQYPLPWSAATALGKSCKHIR